MSQWIKFEASKQLPTTTVWEVRTRDTNEKIGEIRWYGPWRRYAFIPLPNTVWEITCLQDVAEFLNNETAKRKEARSA